MPPPTKLSIPNPNLTKNRTFPKEEVASLQSTIQHEQELAESLEDQLITAQSVCNELLNRYKEQTAVLESIQSQFITAKHHVETLRTQKRTFDRSINRLKATFHPVRSLPPELLSQIFELLEPFEGGEYPSLWQSTQVSQVCHDWRRIAINTPTLWTDIFVDLQFEEEDIRAFWRRVTSRIQNAPAMVRFENVGAGDFNHDTQLLEICDLDQIPVISKLELNLYDPTSETFDILLHFPFPTGTLGHLEVDFYDGLSEDEPEPQESWNWSAFLHQFPPFESLKLEVPTLVEFYQSMPLPALKQVHVWTGNQDLGVVRNLLLLCPNVTDLEIECRYTTSSPHDPPLEMAHLTDLKVNDSEAFPWESSFTCPQLDSFNYEPCDTVISPGVLSFLSQHTSITSLLVSLNDASIVELSTAAPQTKKLTLDRVTSSLEPLYDWHQAGLLSPLFPNLEVLEFDDRQALGFKEFEALVQTRCLPSTHSESRLHSKLTPLKTLVLVPTGTLPWSKYWKTATTMEMACDSIGKTYTSLSWVVPEDISVIINI